MPNVIVTQDADPSFGNVGEWLYSDYNLASTNEADLPSGVQVMELRPTFAHYNGGGFSRVYATGGWSDNLVFTEHFKVCRQGIIAPTMELVSTAPVGSQVRVQLAGTGVTGEAICYLTFWDDLHQRRSPLSGPSPTLSPSNQGFTWSNLPTTAADASVTHIEGWRSMDGNSPRLVWRRDLGATSVTESVATLSLGEDFGDDFEAFPRCRWSLFYHDRQMMAGDDRYPDRLYYSLLNEPERYGSGYLRTRNGARITGLLVIRDYLLVFTAKNCYLVQGYTEDDLEMVELERDIGCISHHGIAHVHNVAFVPAQLGLYLTTGTSFHFMSEFWERTWRREYAANENAYHDSWAVNDPERNAYKLYVGAHSLAPANNGVTAPNCYWVLDYSPTIREVGGNYAQPHLMLDARARVDRCAAVLPLPNSARGYLYTGSDDGKLRKENVAADGGDNSDTYQKFFKFRGPHHYFGQPGGNFGDGNTIETFWEYVESEDQAHTLNLYMGGDHAGDFIDPSWTCTVPAGAATSDESGFWDLDARTEFYEEPNVAGGGMTVSITAANAVGLRISGYGGTRSKGDKVRGVVVQNEDPG